MEGIGTDIKMVKGIYDKYTEITSAAAKDAQKWAYYKNKCEELTEENLILRNDLRKIYREFETIKDRIKIFILKNQRMEGELQ